MIEVYAVLIAGGVLGFAFGMFALGFQSGKRAGLRWIRDRYAVVHDRGLIGSTTPGTLFVPREDVRIKP